ncbi:sulfatase-like hydrolase/transferase [Planctomycetes bacterium K23_9]|uniref:Lipoteichoic acid synthase 2 n=1 Tax=Stieleria marina TaxID=1930275 RepID=A0A517NY39_9BACT|nr:Lipoteichoic acid synthase 2 [Planctomycetes bacterium K23_9]
MQKFAAAFCLFLTASCAASLGAADRPNVVWIVSEDNSVHYLDHFFDGGAKTPYIEAMAAQGLTFDHAFSNAPVCSVARSTLATACYGPRIGTQFHRRYQLAPMPAGLKMWTAYLRDAGYYTTNQSKKDYNAIESDGVWDESSAKSNWRNRKSSDQPFFHMQSHAESHEGRLHFSQAEMQSVTNGTDSDSITLADYFPDTPTFRYTHARYLDCMKTIDGIVGKTIDQLREDGVLEDTFVFYFGDHGGVLPRGKGYIYESGLHVPLVVRVPQNFKHLVDGANGDRVKGFVEFVDFGPTVLQLAGVAIPDQIDGKPFLGSGVSLAEVNQRDETFGYADRFDEKYDLVRSVRKGKYQYVRNFQPYLPDGLMNIYRYKMLAFREWRDLYDQGKLSGPTKQFFERKPAEMLFDCEQDPHQVNNLAGDPKHQQTLLELRQRLYERMQAMPDLSMYPESYLVSNAMDDPVAFGQSHQAEIAELISLANLALVPFEKSESMIAQGLRSDNEMKRYWAAMVCTSIGDAAKPLAASVRPLLDDPSEIVQVRAAEFLGSIGELNPQEKLIAIVNSTSSEIVATEALNSVVWFHDFFGDRYRVKRSDFNPASSGADIDDRLNYINGVPYPPKQKGKRKKPRKKAA